MSRHVLPVYTTVIRFIGVVDHYVDLTASGGYLMYVVGGVGKMELQCALRKNGLQGCTY